MGGGAHADPRYLWEILSKSFLFADCVSFWKEKINIRYHDKKYLRQSNYKEERFIMAHSFKGSVHDTWPITFGPMATQYTMAEALGRGIVQQIAARKPREIQEGMWYHIPPRIPTPHPSPDLTSSH